MNLDVFFKIIVMEIYVLLDCILNRKNKIGGFLFLLYVFIFIIIIF